jgi:hypothetical protein
MRFSIEWWVSRLAVGRSYVAAYRATAIMLPKVFRDMP